MLRNLGSVLAGLFIGMCVNMALVVLNTAVLFPMPPGTDMNDPVSFQAYIDTLPTAAFVVVLLAHLGQSFAGAWVAARLAGSRPMTLALVIGALSLLGGILNMMSVKGPAWLYVELPLYLVLAWAGGTLAMGRRSAT